MKFRITLGAALLALGGTEASDPVHRFWFAPSAHANEQLTKPDEQEHDKHTRHDHARDEHKEHADAENAGHDHAEDDHEEHAGGEHASHDHTEDEHDHEEHVGRKHAEDEHDHEGHVGRKHAEDEHDHEEHADREHIGHDDHAEDQHEDHDEDGAIRLTAEVMREFGIELKIATEGSIARTLRLPGEVVYNADRIAHVSPTVAGSVKQVHVSVGDRVEAGQSMAVLTSRELAAARSDYLAAVARLELARENLARDRRLFSEKVGTKRAAAASRQAHKEADIERNQAVNALYALGYTHQQVTRIAKLDDAAFSEYKMLAPLSGMVTQRHITIGEIIGRDGEDAPFVVADLSSVWVNLTVYQRDLAQVRAGLPVTVEFGVDIPDARGSVAFVSPALDETTRTATARVVLENPRGDYRPGLFVSGLVETGQATAAVLVPNSAVTELDGKIVMFVQTEEGFESREVRLGRMTPQAVEIIDGLTGGERYASNNVLALKSETNRAALEHAGHVH
jgi:cobalt-zinc-cadmium efflux system membrane fusion protein